MARSDRIKTFDLERQLLRYLCKDKVFLQRYCDLCKENWWTTAARRFIYDRIVENYHDHRTILSAEQFDYELEKRFDEKDAKLVMDDYRAEFGIICGIAPTMEIQLIIDKLKEVDLSEDVKGLLEEAFELWDTGKIEEAVSAIRSRSVFLKTSEKAGRVISLHGETDDWEKEILNRRDFPDKYSGIKTGLKKFDEMTGGLFKAELNVIFGLSGKGKSTVMKAIASNVRKAGYNVLHCGNEENEFQMRTKYQALETGIPYQHFKRGNFTEEEFQTWKKTSAWMRTNGGELYIFEFPQQTDASHIERAVNELKLKGIRIDVIFVDYLDLMAPINKSYSENDEQGKVTGDLKQLAINCDCAVVTATQAAIAAEKQELKERPFLNASDVFGTKRKVHCANTLIGIVNQTATVGVNERSEAERLRHRLVLCVPKNRDGAVFTFRVIMDVITGRLEEDLGDDEVADAIEKQTMEMIDETNEKGEVRSSIDLKKIEDAVSEKLQKRLENVVDRMTNAETCEELEETSGVQNSDEWQDIKNEVEANKLAEESVGKTKLDASIKSTLNKKDSVLDSILSRIREKK